MFCSGGHCLLQRLTLSCLGWLACAGVVFADTSPVVVVWAQQDTPQFQQTTESFATSLKASRGIDLVEIQSAGDLRQFEESKPALVFALGSSAVTQVQDVLDGQSMLATMILSTSVLLPESDATAVLLQPSVTKQLEWHRRFLPDARRIGVLYDPHESADWVKQAQIVAAKLDLEILAVPVRSPQELPAALKSLGRRADSILGVPDKTVYSSQTAKTVLLFAFRNRIPFIGMSGAWVKAGALYGLDWNYVKLGQRCAQIAEQILDGKSARDIDPQFQDDLVFQLNMKTAKQLKLNISQELVANASEVYE